jgi:hypothetical protein
MPPELDIHVQRAIIHKVDHRAYDKPQLSDLEAPLSEPVRAYLRRHIRASREHRNSRTAVFDPQPAEDAYALREISDAILEDPDAFVPRSQDMARHLFNHLSGRTSPGDLVVCLFSEDGGDPWLAILKMDPSDAFAGERRQVDGKWQIVLRPIPEVLPTTQQELQKCAFVLPLTLREERQHDLRVLDQQNRRYGVSESVATFFSQGFLQCRIALNQAEMTRKFVMATTTWLEKRAVGLSEEDLERARQEVYQRIQGEHVDIADYARSVLPLPAQRDAYLDHLRQQGIEDLTFTPDPLQRHKLTEYAVFEGDEGLQVQVRTAAVGKMMTCRDDEATGEKVITIRTTRWVQVRGEVNPCS